MFDLQNRDGVCVLRMNNGENRVNPGFIEGFNVALDEVEKANAHAREVCKHALEAKS